MPDVPDAEFGRATSMFSIGGEDSVATIKTEGLLGDRYVEVSFESERAGAIESGDTIRGETPVDFSDAALAVMNQSKTAVASFAEDADALKQKFSAPWLLQTARLRGSDRTQEEQDFSTAVAAQQQEICLRRQGYF